MEVLWSNGLNSAFTQLLCRRPHHGGLLHPSRRTRPAVSRVHTLLITAAFAAGAALAALPAGATRAAEGEYRLPDIGSSARTVISEGEERAYAAWMLRELRRTGLLLDDPLLDGYLQGLGYRLVATSERPTQEFTFFWIRDRQINAFATLAGYVGVNAGLFLHASREDEVAAVLAHEVAHVTQRHVLRGIERAQKDTLPILLGMLGAMVAAQEAGGGGDTTQAVMASASALMAQLQINYTRSNEAEADRIGIAALHRAGYEVDAMASFFERMQRASRSAGAGASQMPDYLRTHPVTTTRISEARNRARTLQAEPRPAPPAPSAPMNPLLPVLFDQGGDAPATGASPELFAWARERLRVLTADSPTEALSEYQRLDTDSDPLLYGLALAEIRAGQAARAIPRLVALSQRHPGLLWVDLARAEAEHRAGHPLQATTRYERLLASQPGNRAVALSYAQALAEHGTTDSAKRAQEVLQPLLKNGEAGDPAFQRTYARAAEVAGNLVRAGEAHAEAAYLSGRPEDAVNLLERLKQEHELDYYQRARVDARIAAMTPAVLEARRRGLRPGQSIDGPRRWVPHTALR